jgi:hypothetical protein
VEKSECEIITLKVLKIGSIYQVPPKFAENLRLNGFHTISRLEAGKMVKKQEVLSMNKI